MSCHQYEIRERESILEGPGSLMGWIANLEEPMALTRDGLVSLQVLLRKPIPICQK